MRRTYMTHDYFPLTFYHTRCQDEANFTKVHDYRYGHLLTFLPQVLTEPPLIRQFQPIDSTTEKHQLKGNND
jgi:hypothetical protein